MTRAKPGRGRSPEKKAASGRPGEGKGGGEALARKAAGPKPGRRRREERAQKPAEGGKPKEKAPKLPVKEPRLQKLYREKIAKALREEFPYPSVQQVPKLEKIVVSMGVGEALANKKLLDAAVKELAQITGQKPVKTKAKKSIANFKIRKGNEIGARVTLRGYQMYEFLDRLVNVALPRVKDFRGINPNAFDGRGNYSLGLTEQIIFPEIDYDKIERIERNEYRDRHHRQDRPGGEEPARPSWGCRSGSDKEERYGQKSDDHQGAEEAQVHDPQGRPLPHLRPVARLHAQVPDVQDLLPETGQRRQDSRRHQVELVGRER